MEKGGEEKGRGVRSSTESRNGKGKIMKKGRVRGVSCHEFYGEGGNGIGRGGEEVIKKQNGGRKINKEWREEEGGR